jgi:pectate lyase-like protein
LKKTLQLGSSARICAAITLISIIAFTGCGSGSKSLAQTSGTNSPTQSPSAPSTNPNAPGFYVSPNGSDSNSGTASAPWATIQHAADVVKPGAVVYVAPGKYGNVRSAVNGTSSGRIRFISTTQWGAQVVGTNGGEAVWQNLGNYVDIMGFDITGNSPNGLENLASQSRMIGNRVHNIVASCNDNGGSGINDANYSATDNDIIGNVVYNVRQAANCGSKHGVGIYHSNLRGHVINNLSLNSGTVGIQLWHAANAVVVANNTVIHSGINGIVIGAGDAPGGITNNNSRVVNNIAIQNGSYGIQEFGSTGSGNKFLNNLASGNPSGDMALQTGSTSGTILSAPAFVNAGGGDYHLASGSPGIDSGTPTSAPSNDINGGARPQGSGFDIGAYETNAPAASWPWM